MCVYVAVCVWLCAPATSIDYITFSILERSIQVIIYYLSITADGANSLSTRLAVEYIRHYFRRALYGAVIHIFMVMLECCYNNYDGGIRVRVLR